MTRQHKERSSALYRLILLLLLAGAGGCEPDDLVVTVTLDGLPADARTVEAAVLLGDRDAQTERFARDQAGYFGLRLPPDAAGPVDIELSGLDDKDCVVGRDVLHVELGSDRRVRLQSRLQMLETPLCRLPVRIQGSGTVATTPAAQCRRRAGVCQLEFERGITVQVEALAGAQARFDSWSVPCGEPATCSLALTETQPLLVVTFAPLVCSAAGVCWENPLPQGQNLNAAWGSAGSQMWAVGDGGTILRSDGEQWNGVASGVVNRLLGVWAAGPTTAWAVGEGPTLLRWNGLTWQRDPQLPMRLFDQLFAVWGVHEASVFVVGTYGTILHWNGTSWQALDSGTANHLYAVTGTDASDTWAVGDFGTVRYFDGKVWQTVRSGITETLYGAAALERGRVLAVGSHGAVIRCSTVGCTSLSSGLQESLRAVGLQGNAAWVVGDNGAALQVVGDTVTKIDGHTSASLRGLSNTTPPWAVGLGGALLRGTGTDWQPLRSYTSDTLSSVYASGAREIRSITSLGDLLSWNGYQWETQHLAVTGGGQPRFLRGAVGDSLILLSADGSMMQYASNRWMAAAKLPASSVVGLTMPSARSALAITSSPPALWQWDGTVWKQLTLTASSDAFACNPKGIFSVDGSTVWVACAIGIIARGDLTGGQVQWRLTNVGFTVNMTAIWGASRDSLWAIGQEGLILHSTDGSTWNRALSTTTADLTAIHGSDDRNIWAVGAEGAVLHYDGTSWQARSSPASHTLRDVRTLPGGPAIIVGDNGTILRAQ